jgi:hypothetical protein
MFNTIVGRANLPYFWDKTADTLPQPELNPLTNPALQRNLSRWAQVYFSNPPGKREQAISRLLQEIKSETSDILIAERVRRESARPSDASPPEDHPAENRFSASQDVRCSACLHVNPPGHRFCGQCGGTLNPASSGPRIGSTWTPRRPAEAPTAQPLRVAQSQDEVQWLRDRAFSHLYQAEPVAWWGWKYVLGGVMIALTGFAYVQWTSLRTGIGSPGRVVTPRVAATAPRTPLGKNPSAAVQRPSEAIPSAAQSSDPGPTASSPTASSPTASGSSVLDSSASEPSAPGPSAPKASAAERADTGNTVGSPEARNARDQETLTAGIPPATEKSWSPRAMPAPNAVESGNSGLNSGMNGGTNELRLAQRYLGGSMGARDSAEAAKLLWKAVRQQNPTAALMLSDLYAHGDGVPKSCDQARLLLLAAAKRGAPQAAQQLRSLQSRGCR